MVETPANSIGAEMASRMNQEADVKRMEELAGKGASDPGSLGAGEVKELCEAILSHLGSPASD